MYCRIALNPLCRQGWPGISDWPDSTPVCWGLNACSFYPTLFMQRRGLSSAGAVHAKQSLHQLSYSVTQF